ncbi:MAG: TonB-dependent receptor family protein [Bacteroidales bacterium]|nr:TonB-dependent receptor family protein [Bacteroidales bacterium]
MTQLGKVATKAFFVSLLILACSFTAFSQNTVSGTLQDENTSKPVQYANVSLLRQSDSVMVSYASANDKGVFQLQMVPNGKYRLVVYFVGYENYEQPVEVNKNLDLGVIKIKPGTTTIGEVVVKGERPLFAVDGEKTLYNTAEDPTVQTGTASDVLQNAPGVSVDVEGNVTLRGTSSVEIWINDKPSHMNAENLKTYLQQMPANSIDHVEVITNPSARYGSKADGIINIVTTTKVMKNQFISFGANASIKPYASPWISYVWSNEKLSINLYSNFSYSMDRYRNVSDITIFQPGLEGRDTVSFEKDSANSKGHNFGGGLHFNLSYEIDSMNNFSLWSGFWPSLRNFDGYSEVCRDMYMDGSQTHYQTSSPSRSKSHWAGFGFYYQHKFDQKGHNLSLDVNGSSWGWGSVGQTDKVFLSPVEYTRSMDERNRSGSFDVNAELTYNRPYSENGEISLGYYGGYTHSNEYDYLDTLDNGVWVRDEMRSNRSLSPEVENQVFFTLQHKFGNFTIKPGVRFEHTYTTVLYPEVVPDTFAVRRHFFHVRPSLHLSYRTKSMHNFRLSYTFRSSNPAADQLTRFVTYGEESFSSGNPDLNSILTHSLEAGWQKYWEKYGSLGVTLYYRAKTRDIDQITVPAYHELYGRPVSFSYPVNVGKAMNTGLEVNTMYRPNAMFNIRLYANVYHRYLETMYDNELYKQQMWSYSFNMSLWAKLWKRLEISVSGYYGSPSISLFSTNHAHYSINAGLRCDFFDKKLSVYLNANDIFNWGSWGYDNDSPYYVSHSTFKYNSRTVALGFTLRFGKMELENQARQGAASESSGGGQGGM